MRSDEFIGLLPNPSTESEQFERVRKNIPLGVDAVGQVVCARKTERAFSARHLCVTGGNRSEFIRRLLITAACLYERSKLCVFVLSPKTEYGELLRMKSMELTLPYVRTKADFDRGVDTLKELLRLRESGKGYPRLLLVVDGIEDLEGCNRNDDLEEYRSLLDLLARQESVDIVTGVELTKTIFANLPAAFVGVHNCLVATRETGKADVTFVSEEISLSMPLPVTYPSAPSVTETVLLFNSLTKDA